MPQPLSAQFRNGIFVWVLLAIHKKENNMNNRADIETRLIVVAMFADAAWTRWAARCVEPVAVIPGAPEAFLERACARGEVVDYHARAQSQWNYFAPMWSPTLCPIGLYFGVIIMDRE